VAIYHSDGDLHMILDDLIDGGIDGLNPLERKAHMDVLEFKRIREELTPCEIILTDIEDTTPDERVLDFYRLCGKIWKMDIRDLVPTTMSR
jgi:hypothetical protein